MSKSLRAALLSALLFPGSGHLWLRHFKTAAALIAISLIALVVVFNFVAGQVRAIVDRILAGDIPLDPIAITEQVTRATTSSDIANVRIALWVLVICWVIGIVDSYRAGRHEPA